MSVRVRERRTGSAVLDEVRDPFCSQADDRQARRLRLADDLAERLGAAGRRVSTSARGWLEQGERERGAQTWEGENVGARVRRRELLALLEAKEESVEPVRRTQALDLGPRRPVADEDELACRPASRQVGLLEPARGVDEQAQVLLPRDAADVEDGELARRRSGAGRRRERLSGVGRRKDKGGKVVG